MGARGPIPKEADRRHTRRPASGLVAVVDSHVAARAEVSPDVVRGKAAPPARREWLMMTRRDWDAFFASPLAPFVEATDHAAVLRLFDLRDSRERWNRALRKEPLVIGSQGQPVANPLAKMVQAADSEIRQLEDRFGLSTASRARLGIKIGEARRSLADLNAELAGDDDGD